MYSKNVKNFQKNCQLDYLNALLSYQACQKAEVEVIFKEWMSRSPPFGTKKENWLGAFLLIGLNDISMLNQEILY